MGTPLKNIIWSKSIMEYQFRLGEILIVEDKDYAGCSVKGYEIVNITKGKLKLRPLREILIMGLRCHHHRYESGKYLHQDPSKGIVSIPQYGRRCCVLPYNGEDI